METQQMPQFNLRRLTVEFTKVQRAIREGAAPGGLSRCEPVEDSLLEWDADMVFPEGSPLQEGLEDLAAAAGEPGQSHLALRARFPLDYPASPPEVWVRRPRLVHRSGGITFGGRLCTQLLSSSGWAPATAMTTVFQDVQKSLLDSGAEVDNTVPMLRNYVEPTTELDRMRTDLYPVANNFSRRGITTLSTVEAGSFLGDLTQLEQTDKIALPLAVLGEICERRALDTPVMFEVKSRLGRKRHCGVSWMDGIPPNHAILPKCVMEDLFVGEREQVQVRGVKLELITYVKVQPHSAEFYDAVASTGREVRELLTESFSGFSALTEDTSVPIQVGGRHFPVQITSLRPQGAVRLIDDNVEQFFEFQVDFEPAPDLEDKAAMKARNNRLLADYKAQQEKVEAEKKSQEEQRLAVIHRHYEAALGRARAAAGPHDGTGGDVEVPLALPDGTRATHRFPEGAPAAALVALALSSPWGQANKPWGVQLRERAPPARVLEEGLEITRAMHRSVVMVREQVPEEGDLLGDDADSLPSATAEPAELRAEEAPPAPLEMERSVSALERGTLQAFEVQSFLRAGVPVEEALRRARNGEVLRPAAPPAPSPGREEAAPPAPAAAAAAEDGEEGRREAMVREVMTIVGIDGHEARQALENNGWDTQRTMNAIFDSFGAD